MSRDLLHPILKQFLGLAGPVPAYSIVCFLCLCLVPDSFPCRVPQYDTLTVLLTHSCPFFQMDASTVSPPSSNAVVSNKSEHDLKGIIVLSRFLYLILRSSYYTKRLLYYTAETRSTIACKQSNSAMCAQLNVIQNLFLKPSRLCTLSLHLFRSTGTFSLRFRLTTACLHVLPCFVRNLSQVIPYITKFTKIRSEMIRSDQVHHDHHPHHSRIVRSCLITFPPKVLINFNHSGSRLLILISVYGFRHRLIKSIPTVHT